MKSLGVLFCVILLGNTALAEGITAQGGVDCAQWVGARTENISILNEQYLIGFLDGLALGKQIEFWEAKEVSVSREQTFFWMDMYCKDNPLSHSITGAFKLFEERTR